MRSLRVRLILSHIIPLLVVVPVVGFVLVYLLESQVLLANSLADLTRQAVLVADIASDYTGMWVDPAQAQAFISRIAPRLSAQVMLLDPLGRLLSSSDPKDANKIGQVFPIPSSDMPDQSSPDPQVNYDPAKGAQVAYIFVPVVTPTRQLIGYVRMANPLTSVYERFAQVRQVIIIVSSAGLLLGVVLGWVFARNLERPLRGVTEAVTQLARDQQSDQIQEQGPDEVRLLVRAINTLTQRLQTLEQSRRQLLANVVHELGNPLGALRSAIQALLGGADEDVSLRKDLLAGMDGELGRLQHLLEDLSHLHDQVLGSLDLCTQAVFIQEWLPRVILPWREAALEKHLSWEYTCPEDLPGVSIDPDRLAQAMGNLLSNAIRYTPAEGRVSVSAAHVGEELWIQVRDSGPGIGADEQNSIFTPFYRGRASRRFERGMGLGLTIARDLVVAHGGELRLESQPGSGSTFTISLPLN